MASKSFEKNKNYRIGRKRAGSTNMRIAWTKKPAPKPLSGSWLIDNGVYTTEDFFKMNPVDMETNVSVIITEIDGTTGDDMYFDEGVFMNRRSMNGTLQDAPNFGTPPPTHNANTERAYQNHVQDLKDQLLTANARIIEQDKQATKQREAHEQELKDKEKEIGSLKDKIRDLQMELKIEKTIAERLGTKLDDKGLADTFSGIGEATQHFQKAFAEKAVEKLSEWGGNIVTGRKPNPAAATVANPADELGIPNV